LIYAAISVLAVVVAYLDPVGVQSQIAFGIGLLSATAALTVYLRRQDYRALSREYSGETIELPSRLST
jgi:hypothetical protein